MSFGKATVSYSNKDEAANAQRKLHFEKGLGHHTVIDFYKLKQQRIVEQYKSGNQGFM